VFCVISIVGGDELRRENRGLLVMVLFAGAVEEESKNATDDDW